MKEQFVKNAQLAILEETAKHFRAGNRSVAGNKSCQYAPTPISDGCAIGRKVDNKALCRFWDNQAAAVTTAEVFQQLGPLRVLGLDFLLDLQSLHDVSIYWDGNGLSEMGKRRVEFLKNHYELT